MRNYEINYLISSKLSEEEVKKISEKINSFIREEEGILDRESNSSKLRLGYPIKKERQVNLLVSDFSVEPEKLGNLEKKIKSEPMILRFLISTKKAVRVEFRRQKFAPKIKTFALSSVREKITKPLSEEEKVELEDIEKKLEEILGEI